MEQEILFRTILAHFEKGQAVVLCSIISASGSSPRAAGAKMAVFADGTIAGTVGGGAVEQHAIAQAKEIFRTGRSMQKGYCLAPNEIADIGMVCGGNVTVQFTRMEADAKNAAVFERLLADMDDAAACWLVMRLQDGAVAETCVYDRKCGLQFAQTVCDSDVLPRLSAKPVLDGDFYIEPISTEGTVFVFGGGHVGAALVPVLHSVGFHVTVFDSREAVAKKENFPLARRVIFGDYENISEKVTIGAHDYVVILTPGHIGDRSVLLQAMRSPACYIGCIGSRKKIASTNAYLMENGIEEAALSRIHAPIGLPILAQTPQEIAVSIAAELIEHRAKRNGEDRK